MLRVLNSSKIEAIQFKSLAIKANEISVQNIKKEVDFNDAPDEFRGLKENIMLSFKIPFNILKFQIH